MKKDTKNYELEIELITCTNEDYEVLKANNEIYYSGHSVPNEVWSNIFKLEGNKVLKTTISNKKIGNC